jgi:hypothetical protein
MAQRPQIPGVTWYDQEPVPARPEIPGVTWYDKPPAANEEPEKGPIEKWENLWINKPQIEAFSRWGKSAGEAIDIDTLRRAATEGNTWDIGLNNPYMRGFASGAVEGLGNLASGFTTPLNIATMGAFKGASLLGKTAPQLARLLHLGGRALSAPVAGTGVGKVYSATTRPLQEGEGWGARATEAGIGLAEAAGGFAGMAEPYHAPSPRKPPPPSGVGPSSVPEGWLPFENIPEGRPPVVPETPTQMDLPFEDPHQLDLPLGSYRGPGGKFTNKGPSLKPKTRPFAEEPVQQGLDLSEMLPPDDSGGGGGGGGISSELPATVALPNWTKTAMSYWRSKGYGPSGQRSPEGWPVWVRGETPVTAPVVPKKTTEEIPGVFGENEVPYEEGADTIVIDDPNPNQIIIDERAEEGYKPAGKTPEGKSIFKRFITETKGTFDPDEFFRNVRRLTWADRTPRQPLHGGEEIPSLAFQPDEGVQSTREFSENINDREQINRETEVQPEGWMNNISISHPAYEQEAIAIYRETDPQKIVQNLARYAAEFDTVRQQLNEAYANNSRYNTPVPPELVSTYRKANNFRDLAQSKYERAGIRAVQGQRETLSPSELIAKFVSEEEGSFSWQEMWENLKRLLGREPTQEEVELGMSRQVKPGEETGKLAYFEPKGGFSFDQPDIPNPAGIPGLEQAYASEADIPPPAEFAPDSIGANLPFLNPPDRPPSEADIVSQLPASVTGPPGPLMDLTEWPPNSDIFAFPVKQGSQVMNEPRFPEIGPMGEGAPPNPPLPPKTDVEGYRQQNLFERFLKEDEGSSQWEFWGIEWAKRRLRDFLGREPSNEEIAMYRRVHGRLPGEGETPVIPDIEEAGMMDAATANAFMDDVIKAQEYWQQRFDEFARMGDEAGTDIARDNQMEAEDVQIELEKAIRQPEFNGRTTHDDATASSNNAFTRARDLIEDGAVDDAHKIIYDEAAKLNKAGFANQAEGLVDSWNEFVKDFFAESDQSKRDLGIYGDSSREQAEGLRYENEMKRDKWDEPTEREMFGQQELPLNRLPEFQPRELPSDANVGRTELPKEEVQPTQLEFDFTPAEKSLLRRLMEDEGGYLDLDVLKRVWRRIREDETGAVGDLNKLRRLAKGMFKDKDPARYSGENLSPEQRDIKAAVDRGLDWYNGVIDRLEGTGPKGPLYGQRLGAVHVEDSIILRRAYEAKLEALPADGTFAKDSPKGRAILKEKNQLIDKINKLLDKEEGLPITPKQKEKAATRLVELKAMWEKSRKPEQDFTVDNTIRKEYGKKARELGIDPDQFENTSDLLMAIREADPNFKVSTLKRFIKDETGAVPLDDIKEAYNKVTGKVKQGVRNAFKPGPKGEPSTFEEIVGGPTAATTIGDVSGMLRQGFPLIFTPEWRNAVIPMFRSLKASEAKLIDAELKKLPVYQRKRDMQTGKVIPSLAEKLNMPMIENGQVSRSEHSIGSSWVESGKFLGPAAPLYQKSIGKWVAAPSNRAYATFLNHLRGHTLQKLLDTGRNMAIEATDKGSAPMPGIMGGFKIPFTEARIGFRQKYTKAEAAELNPYKNLVLAREIADFVNTATGRGPAKIASMLKGEDINLEFTMKALRWGLFSPRNLFSKIRMIDPSTYVMASPFVRKQYMKAAVSAGVAWWSMAQLAKLHPDVEVSDDPDSADYMKPRIGNFRMDPGGGFQQFLVAGHRLWSGGWTSSATNDWHRYGEGFRAETQGDAWERFFVNKMNPVMKFAYDLAHASENQPFQVGDRLLQLYVNLTTQDLIEIINEDPNLLPAMIPVVAGMGTQIYDKGEAVSKFISRENDWTITGGGIKDRLRETLPQGLTNLWE